MEGGNSQKRSLLFCFIFLLGSGLTVQTLANCFKRKNWVSVLSPPHSCIPLDLSWDSSQNLKLSTLFIQWPAWVGREGAVDKTAGSSFVKNKYPSSMSNNEKFGIIILLLTAPVQSFASCNGRSWSGRNRESRWDFTLLVYTEGGFRYCSNSSLSYKDGCQEQMSSCTGIANLCSVLCSCAVNSNISRSLWGLCPCHVGISSPVDFWRFKNRTVLFS